MPQRLSERLGCLVVPPRAQHQHAQIVVCERVFGLAINESSQGCLGLGWMTVFKKELAPGLQGDPVSGSGDDGALKLGPGTGCVAVRHRKTASDEISLDL
jgi:hypothetical protein